MTPFACTVWRMIPAGADPLAPAAAPEGRFHHSGQRATCCSLTAEGTRVATRRYLADGLPRQIVLLRISLHRLADMTGRPTLSVVWQDIRAAGRPAPTWAFSDAARAEGAEALLYSSRSRPDLTHMVLFAPAAALVLSVGAAAAWPT